MKTVHQANSTDFFVEFPFRSVKSPLICFSFLEKFGLTCFPILILGFRIDWTRTQCRQFCMEGPRYDISHLRFLHSWEGFENSNSLERGKCIEYLQWFYNDIKFTGKNICTPILKLPFVFKSSISILSANVRCFHTASMRHLCGFSYVTIVFYYKIIQVHIYRKFIVNKNDKYFHATTFTPAVIFTNRQLTCFWVSMKEFDIWVTR